MRIAVLGAGALGGYFGGRLAAAGRDVTFLLRAKRAQQLAQSGLIIKSPLGDAMIPAPKIVEAAAVTAPYDLIILSCKAYDLIPAMAAIAPAIGRDSLILPLLNGMAHIEALQQRFGAAQILGGLCMISASLDQNGHVIHFNTLHGLTYGALAAPAGARLEAIEACFSGANFTASRSSVIRHEMWQKWVFIASLAGITCLMRSPIGDIAAAGGAPLAAALFDECVGIAVGNG